MDVSILDLPNSVVASYEQAARSRGISLDAFLREYLIANAPAIVSPRAKRFAELRERIVASGVPLLNDDELRAEIGDGRGDFEH